jgi:hypothetical protein
MQVGRPIEDLSSLPKDWYKEILSLYEEGASDVEIKALIYHWRGSFSNSLWDRWLLDYQEFSQTIKTGRLLAESWWAKNGRTNLQNKDFSYTGWYMQMKNRYGWTDRTDVTTKDKEINTTPTIVFKKFNDEQE